MAPEPKPHVFRNKLLQALSSEDLDLLTPHLTPISLALRDEIERPNQPIKMVVFPESGVVSIVAHGGHKKQIEAGIVGREGMTGLMVVLGNDRSPHFDLRADSGAGAANCVGRFAPGDAEKPNASQRHASLRAGIHDPGDAYRNVERQRETGGAAGSLAAHGARPR
jgi:hypothetical protein